MTRTSTLSAIPARLAPLAEELLENRNVRRDLREGTGELRDAYSRARKRRVEPVSDRKLRRQLVAAASSFDHAARALAARSKPPKRRRRSSRAGLLVLAAAGAGAAYWYVQEHGSSASSHHAGAPA